MPLRCTQFAGLVRTAFAAIRKALNAIVGLLLRKRPIVTLDDWIPDEAITSFEDDRLGHRPIVKTVADLIELGPVPANIAVFGPWGSGKTSFGRLLEQELATRDKARIKFVRFDAWKYQETPLRRHFLSQVMGQLLDDPKKAEASRQLLYQKVHKTTYRLSKEDVWPAVLVGASLLALIVGIAVMIAMLGAWMVESAKAPFWPGVASRLSANLPAVLLSTAVLAPLVAILMGPLTKDLEESEPSSAEQFDRAFRDLAETSLKNWGRIAFFIDELDRAPANAVVSTLETIKTFLGATGCVFVVAADQIVLESALQQKPPVALTDRDNPYFTAGSAYLDKVFGFQFSLPPIAQGRLTPFAKALVNGRGGVWADLGADADLVVSVLVPFHVRSPRRAKVLLNNFVLAYRNLQQLPDLVPSGDPKSGAAELAKLVCLRTEFPVFYRTVEAFPELVPAITAALTENVSLKRYEADEDLMAQVRHFLKSDATVDIMLAPVASPTAAEGTEVSRAHDGNGLEVPEDEPSDEGSDESEGEGDAGGEEAYTSEGHDATSEGPISESQAPIAGKTLADHLHQYLINTAAIPGPSRNLIYQEAQAAPAGLELSLAKNIAEAAYSGDPKRAIAELSRAEEGERRAALRYLGMLLSESVGIEKRSVLHVLLSVAGAQPDGVLKSVANDVLDHIVNAGAIASIDPKDYPAAFSLAAHAPAMRREDMEHHLAARAAVDPEAARATFQAFPRLSRSGQRVVREVAAELAGASPGRLVGTEAGVADAVTRQIWKGEPVLALARSLRNNNPDGWAFARTLISHLDTELAWVLIGGNLESPTPERLESVAGLLSEGAQAPPNRAAFDKLLGAMAIDPLRVELYAHAVPQAAVAPSDGKLAAVLVMLIDLAPKQPAEAHIGMTALLPHLKVSPMPADLLAPLHRELEVPFSQTAEIIAARDAQHQLIFDLAKEDIARESGWLDLLADSLIAMLGTGEPIIEEGRLLFRRGVDSIWRARPTGETLGRLEEALRTDRAVADSFTPAERRLNRAMIIRAMQRLSVGPLPNQDSDISAALSGTTLLERQTVAILASTQRPDPAVAPDLVVGAIFAAESDVFSRKQLSGYFGSLTPAKALGLLRLCLERQMAAPQETLRLVKPRASERDWTEMLRQELRSAATNPDRGRILKFIAVADIQEPGNAAKLRKTLVDVAGGSHRAFELVVRASTDLAQGPGFVKETKRLKRDLEKTLSRRFSGAGISATTNRILDDLA